MPDHRHMLAEELMYFHGAPLAHVVDYHEQLRMKRKAGYMKRLLERRTGSRARSPWAVR